MIIESSPQLDIKSILQEIRQTMQDLDASIGSIHGILKNNDSMQEQQPKGRIPMWCEQPKRQLCEPLLEGGRRITTLTQGNSVPIRAAGPMQWAPEMIQPARRARVQASTE